MAMESDNNDRLEQDINNAFRARGLREAMQTWDEEARRKQEQEQKPKQEQEQKQEPKQHIVPLRTARRLFTALAVAAVLCGLIVTAVPVSTWRTGYRFAVREIARLSGRDTRTQHYANTDEVLLALASPAVDEIAERAQNATALGAGSLLAEAAEEMRQGHYRIARALLDDAASSLDADDSSDALFADDIDYMAAVCELGLGHRARAKRLLSAIAAAPGPYSARAAELLKHFK